MMMMMMCDQQRAKITYSTAVPTHRCDGNTRNVVHCCMGWVDHKTGESAMGKLSYNAAITAPCKNHTIVVSANFPNFLLNIFGFSVKI